MQYINIQDTYPLRYDDVDEEQEERVPVCIPRRIPHGATHATGMPFRLWAIMSILSQAFRVGPKHILQIKIIFSVAHVRVCVIVRVCVCVF